MKQKNNTTPPLPIAITAKTEKLPTKFGVFSFFTWKSDRDQVEHIGLQKGNLTDDDVPLVRIQSACMTSETFMSLKCDCRDQLHRAMEQIGQEKVGLLIYLNQEGRGIGLANKIRAYALQEQGYDTLEANRKLGLKADQRDYAVVTDLLTNLGVKRIRLITNSPDRIQAIEQSGIEVVEQVAVPSLVTSHNADYLKLKIEKLQHQISLEN